MMKKLLFVITLLLLFVAYSCVHDLISNSAFGMLDPATQQYTRVDHGWNAVLAAWPIALAGLAWFVHVAADRAFGYGLRDADGRIIPVE